MDILDILGFLFVVAIGWLWLGSIRSREIAVSAARAACDSEALQLLDDTVAIQRIGVGRDGGSVLRIRRSYAFEYSDTGNDRRTGNLVMLGNRVLVTNLGRPGMQGHDRQSVRPWLH